MLIKALSQLAALPATGMNYYMLFLAKKISLETLSQANW